MKTSTATWRGYVIVGAVAAAVGGLSVALATRAVPRMAAGIASGFMRDMAERMREVGCDPPEI